MGDDIGSGLVCFDFCRSAALHCWVCTFRAENDLKRQSVTEPEPMSSPINYPAYITLRKLEQLDMKNNVKKCVDLGWILNAIQYKWVHS